MLAVLIAALIPLLNVYAFEGLQKLLGFLDKAPGWAKTLLAILLPIGFNMLATWLKIPNLPGDMHGWTEEITLSILQGLASVGIHEKQRQAATGNTKLTPIV